MGVDSEAISEDDAVGTDDIVGKLATKQRGGTEKVDGIKDEPRLGWLARYCRYCERNPWTGFLSVFFTVLVMAAVVGAFGLASFDSESDKVGVSWTAPLHHIRNLPFRNDDTFSGRRYPSPSAHPPRFIQRIYPTFSYVSLIDPYTYASQEWVILEDDVTSRTVNAGRKMQMSPRG